MLISTKACACVAAALALCSFALTACSSASTTDASRGGSGSITPQMSATKTSCPSASSCFVSANIATIGGIVPGLFKGALVGTDAFLAYQNSLGGLEGRKFKLLSGDDQLSCNLNQSLTRQYASEVIAFTGSFSLQDNCGGQVLASMPSLPNVSQVLNTSVAQLPNTFEPQPGVGPWGTGALTYYAARNPEAVKHVGELIAGVSSSEAEAAKQDAAMRQVGYAIVYSRTYGPLETDFTADVLHMRSAGVQAVNLTSIDAKHAAFFMQEAATQGFHPPLVFSEGPIYTDDFVKQAGGAAVVEGAYLDQGAALYLGQDASSVPAVRTFLTWVHGLYPGFSPDLFTLYGWASAALYVQALHGAGGAPTPQSLLQALQRVHTFTADGLQPQSDPAGKQASSCYLLARIVNGQFVRTDMPATGFKCEPSP